MGLNERYLLELFDHIKVRFKPLQSISSLKNNSFLLVVVDPSSGLHKKFPYSVFCLNDDDLHISELPPSYNLIQNNVLTGYYGMDAGEHLILPKHASIGCINEILCLHSQRTPNNIFTLYHIEDEFIWVQIINYISLINLNSIN